MGVVLALSLAIVLPITSGAGRRTAYLIAGTVAVLHIAARRVLISRWSA